MAAWSSAFKRARPASGAAACGLAPVFRALPVLVSLLLFRAMSTEGGRAQCVPGAESVCEDDIVLDPEYPGTALERLFNIHQRVGNLTLTQLRADWVTQRRSLLWAGGLRDLPNAQPGMGYTGHSFNDFNHCDLTAMLGSFRHKENSPGDNAVQGIALGNRLGAGIEIASLPELGPGGSWSTCMMGCKTSPPRDVAHLQFKSRIAFKLVWVPPDFTKYVLVDDSGRWLTTGEPASETEEQRSQLPHIQERAHNYHLVKGSKYAVAADRVAASMPRPSESNPNSY